MQTKLYQDAHDANAAFIDPRPREGETLALSGARFNEQLNAWLTAHRNGRIIATHGIGADGHTAGIFPRPNDPEEFAREFVDTDVYAIGYAVPATHTLHTERITVTVPFLTEHIDHAIVFATGSEKREALSAALDSACEMHVTPACVLQRMRRVEVYTDIESVLTGKSCRINI
jgi:6-phosphogluconolactonase/glucosamine-6-phosphate isomerase/deaminase